MWMMPLLHSIVLIKKYNTLHNDIIHLNLLVNEIGSSRGKPIRYLKQLEFELREKKIVLQHN